jgi:hypothetical protein
MTSARFSGTGGVSAARIPGLSRAFERMAAHEIQAGHRSWPSFQICGCTGLALAIILAMTLVGHAGLSHWVMSGIVGTAVGTFLGLVMATKIITGEDRIIYYHHEIAVMLITALFLWTIRRPQLPYLDATILGIGLFLSCGRIGCLMVGCCHGRPHRWGLRYGEEHAAAGFPSYLVGVRLFPIQAVESLWVLGTVVVGTYFVWSGRQPGTALAWYIVTYNVGRFFFEFARGDAGRPYWLGFSQAQWLSLLLTGGVVWAERVGHLPLSPWHLAALAFLAGAMIAVALWRRFQKAPAFLLLHPRHIQQVAEVLGALDSLSDRAISTTGTSVIVPIVRTSLGVQISGGRIDCATERVYHYTFSSASEPMTESAAKLLAGLIRYLSGAAASERLVAGPRGVFHCLICAPKATICD